MVYPEMKSRSRITPPLFRGSFAAGRMNSLIILWVTAILTLLGASCTTGQQNPTRFQNAPLYGMIYDYQNMPVKGVIIREGEQILGESDINGRFYLPEIEQGMHELVMEKEGYERLNLSFQFQNRTEALYIKMRSAFDCMTEANRMLARQSYARAEELITLGLEIQPDHLGLLFLKSLYHYELRDFPASFGQIALIMEEYQRREKELYLMLNQIRSAEPELEQDISQLISRFPPPPQWNIDPDTPGTTGNEPSGTRTQEPEKSEHSDEGATNDSQ